MGVYDEGDMIVLGRVREVFEVWKGLEFGLFGWWWFRDWRFWFEWVVVGRVGDFEGFEGRG